MKKLKNKQL